MKKTFLIFFLVFSSLVIMDLKNYASNDELLESGDEIKLYLGETKIITVHNPKRIAIGNPKIADVSNVTREGMTISPKDVGKTTLVFWDDFGAQSYQINVASVDIGETKRRIDNLLAMLNLPEVYTKAQEEEGRVLLLGRVKTDADKSQIMSALGSLRDKIVDLIAVREEEAVVEIDVQVLELDQDASRTLGFTWPGNVSITEVGSPGITQTVGTTSVTTGTNAQTQSSQQTPGTGWTTLFRVLNFSREAFSLSVDAMVQEGKAKILSKPRLACQSGKEAELLVGGEKPIFTTSVQATGTTSTSVSYKEYGIKLNIKPTVTDDKQIKLALKVEVSEVGSAETIGNPNAPSAKAWPILKRTTNTELFMDNGQTLGISGLIKQKSEEDLRKVPFLGDVPILGLFFRKSSTKSGGGQGERADTELYITLTPRIIREGKKVERIVQKETTPAQGESFVSAPEKLSLPKIEYANMIQSRILDKLTYPSIAREAGFQGTLRLTVHISSSGELLDIAVKDSSGYRILDEQAISVAKEIAPFPPFPSSIEQKDFWIDVPIVFSLD